MQWLSGNVVSPMHGALLEKRLAKGPSGLGDSTGGNMLRNPLCFVIHVLVGILQTAHDASTAAVLMDYVPGLDTATSRLTDNCAGADESCVMTPFLIPSMITSCHVVHSPSIRSPSSQLCDSGLGDSTGGKMLRNPLCFVIQVLVGILQTAHDASTAAVLMDYVPGLDTATSRLTDNCAGADESCVMTPFLIPSMITSCHVVHSPSIRSPSSQLGDSTGGKMLRNPLCFVIQVLVGILQTAHDASTAAVLMDYVPGLDTATSRLTDNCAGADESCVMTPFLIPSMITSCHVVHSPSIRSPSSQLGDSGLGDSTGGKMLRNPLCFVIQVLVGILANCA
ncbi:hypothetical protein MTO96_022563 [Rhipicephalus appendiculatus]